MRRKSMTGRSEIHGNNDIESGKRTACKIELQPFNGHSLKLNVSLAVKNARYAVGAQKYNGIYSGRHNERRPQGVF